MFSLKEGDVPNYVIVVCMCESGLLPLYAFPPVSYPSIVYPYINCAKLTVLAPSKFSWELRVLRMLEIPILLPKFPKKKE